MSCSRYFAIYGKQFGSCENSKGLGFRIWDFVLRINLVVRVPVGSLVAADPARKMFQWAKKYIAECHAGQHTSTLGWLLVSGLVFYSFHLVTV